MLVSAEITFENLAQGLPIISDSTGANDCHTDDFISLYEKALNRIVTELLFVHLTMPFQSATGYLVLFGVPAALYLTLGRLVFSYRSLFEAIRKLGWMYPAYGHFLLI